MAIRAAMHEIVTETPWYGYRPMTKALRRALRIEINEKRVRRLMKLDGLIASRKTVRRWLSPSMASRSILTSPPTWFRRRSINSGSQYHVRSAAVDFRLRGRGS